MGPVEQNLAVPPDETIIWRYVDFARFMAILDRSSLWFSRIGSFDDADEGTFSAPSSMAMLAETARTSGMPPGVAADYVLLQHGAMNTISRMCAFANCWCGKRGESASLWNIYGQAVTIQSTVGRLKQSLLGRGLPDIQFGQVQYVEDPELEITGNVSIAKAVLTKQLAYEDEREIRAFFLRYPSDEDVNDLSRYEIPPGIPVRVDLNTLIEKVVVAPKQSEWFRSLVESVMKSAARSHGFATKPVEWSHLRGRPHFYRDPAVVTSRKRR